MSNQSNEKVSGMNVEMVVKESIKLPPFLPTAKEIENMNNKEFIAWMKKATKEIPERVEQREPLFHLKKRIIGTIENNHCTDAEKEEYILKEIKGISNWLRGNGYF